jgi:hypothetical protein
METYPYKDMIKTPQQMGVSDAGNLGALSADIKAITGYVGVITSGETNAQMAPTLGNKYFFKTGTTCVDMTGVSQARYAFVNNVPDNQGFGKGLVPGMIQNLTSIDPTALFKAFSSKTDNCQEITMDTQDNENNTGQESRYVNRSDIKTYNPCWFSNKTNPVTNTTCKESFSQRQIPKDPVVQVYLAGIGCLAAFMVYRFMKK